MRAYTAKSWSVSNDGPGKFVMREDAELEIKRLNDELLKAFGYIEVLQNMVRNRSAQETQT